MKICLVTTFPPSRGGLAEYGFHIAREMQRDPLLSLTVLADELPSPQPELEGFSVDRCWSFNSAKSPGRLLRTIRKLSPDVVWFNLLFTTFGHNPLVAFYGLTTPLLTRLAGFHTHVTLHHLMEVVDLQDAQIRFPKMYRAAGRAATKLLLRSNAVSVLMPGYRRILVDQYGSGNVHVRPHGNLAQRPQYPDFSLRGNPEQRILAFGKWGTYKRLEVLVAAFEKVSASVPNAKLVIAGTDHPRAAGYVESVARQLKNDPRVQFTGYVAEDELPHLFGGASIVVMPYSSATGASGVAHLACAYGNPIISADILDFRQMEQEEGLAMDFYPPGQSEALADCMVSLLESPERQRRMAGQNFSAALRTTMPRVVHDYLRHFDRTRRSKMLGIRSRARSGRLPSASVSMAQNWVTMGHGHTPFLAAPADGGSLPLLDGQSRRGRDLQSSGDSAYGDGISPRSDAHAGNALAGNAASPAGAKQDHQDDEREQKTDLGFLPAAKPSHSNETSDPKTQPISGIEGLPVILPPGLGGYTGNGKGRTALAGPGADQLGIERAGETLGEA